jgi:hypothetical protein
MWKPDSPTFQKVMVEERAAKEEILLGMLERGLQESGRITL